VRVAFREKRRVFGNRVRTYHTRPEANGMNPATQEELSKKRCAPCEGGVPPLSREEAVALAQSVQGWVIDADTKQISRAWTVRNFMAGIEFFNKVAALAEEEGHHPDLHLEGYRHVRIVLWTHAVGGLTENDFILAAKINLVPVQVRR
jgi:4a-hydroxytetrahydrobiopterin dehydratase